MGSIDAPFPAIPPVSHPPPAPINSPGAVVAPTEPGDRWTALKKIGWWKPIDTILLGLLMSHLITGFFFLVFGKLTFNVAVIGLLQCCVITMSWIVMLVYRAMDFIVQLRANIEMLPFDSARIAVGFMKGGQE